MQALHLSFEQPHRQGSAEVLGRNDVEATRALAVAELQRNRVGVAKRLVYLVAVALQL